MSCMMNIYTESKLLEKDIIEFVKTLGGYILNLGNFNKGVITKDDATIWIYYRGDNIKQEKNIISKIQNEFDIDVNTEIALEIGHADYSEKLALEFCIKFIGKYPKSVVNYGEYIRMNKLRKLYEAPIIDY